MAFVKVAEAESVSAGTGTTVTVSGRDYALFHIDGEFFCIDNECPHRDGPLGDGELEDDTVICPWHAWQVNVKTGQVLYTSNLCVATHACKVEEGSVYIDL